MKVTHAAHAEPFPIQAFESDTGRRSREPGREHRHHEAVAAQAIFPAKTSDVASCVHACVCHQPSDFIYDVVPL